MTPLLFALPWIGILLFVCFIARAPSELPHARTGATEESGGVHDEGVRVAGRDPAAVRPPVSVIVPARNEAHNIERCVSSIAASEYPDFEIIVVDDRSDDGTGGLARRVSVGNARRVTVVDGEELPQGWLGKPWACHQGARLATGDLLLFTDADTTHGVALMGRAVAGLEEEAADLLTVVGRQLMETFWERLVQPQIFLVMLFRFPDFERAAKNGRWRDAIANGQYLLFPRASYTALGGHPAVKDEVVEDLALAQLVKRKEQRLRIRSAESDFATRMYRSLAQIVEGWSKNIVIGGLQSVPALLRPVVPPVALMSGVALWLAPPVVLVLSAIGWAVGGSGPLLTWSATVCLISVLSWSIFTHQMRAPAAYGMLYPLGAAVGVYIFVRSWIGGRNVEWKGRRYRVRAVGERA